MLLPPLDKRPRRYVRLLIVGVETETRVVWVVVVSLSPEVETGTLGSLDRFGRL